MCNEINKMEIASALKTASRDDKMEFFRSLLVYRPTNNVIIIIDVIPGLTRNPVFF